MRTLFSGGLVFDGDTSLLTGRNVLVENGRIAAVRPPGEFTGFTGETIDIAGMTIMPGLIDCHVHLTIGGEPRGALEVFHRSSPSELALRALENAQETLRGGVTSARDCGDREYNSLTARDAINAGRHLGPTLRCAGRIVCMRRRQGSWANGREVDTADETARAVHESIESGVDFIKFTATGACTEPSSDTTLAEHVACGAGRRRRRGPRARSAHCMSRAGHMGLGNAVRAGVTSIEHGFTMSEQTLAEMVRRRTYLVPTLSRFATFLADENTPPYMLERVRQWSALQRKAVMDFYRAGGLLAMGTDAGSPNVAHGENGQELRYLVEIGIRPVDALRIATGRGADLLGLADRGRVKEGHWADLLIVRGNPSKDIEAAADRSRHAFVLKNGYDVLATLGRPKSGAAFPRFNPELATV